MVSVSILLATYNGARYLPDLLWSLETQTYPLHEIVCCDDASEDETVRVLNDFSQKCHTPVRIYRNEKRKGYRKNFWEGIKLCNGDFVAFCDQDDVWKKQKIEKLVSRINANLAPSMIFSDAELVDDDLKPLNTSALKFSGMRAEKWMKIQRGELLEVLLKHPLIPGMTMMVHRQRASLNIPKNTSLMHDYALSIGFAIGGDYEFVNESLVHYRQHSNNAIGMNSDTKKKRKKRGHIWNDEYFREVNSDLIDKLITLRYLSKFNKVILDKTEEHMELILSEIKLALFRKKRRLSFQTLLTGKVEVPKLELSNLESRRIWMKDFRSRIRLVFSAILIKILKRF